MNEHLRKITSEEIKDHYLGKNIQNELIQLIGNQVLQEIMKQIIKCKYYSILLDCTPDVDHEEQLSVILRFVEIDSNTSNVVTVVKRFVGFISVQNVQD